jgi:ornithine carbamoyltransferase
MKKDLLTVTDLAKEEIQALMMRGLEMKREGRPVNRPFRGYTLGLLFDKQSTRTRVSFETAMFRLGGDTLFLKGSDTQLARNEPVKDTARVLSRYVDVLAIRTYSQQDVEEMAHWADIPVINALTDKYHPCQILSDFMTVLEKGKSPDNLKVAWVGDGNNVANSWIHLASLFGFELVLACPEGYGPDPDVLTGAGDNVRLVLDPSEAAQEADVINTDVWISMGQDAEREKRLKDFQGFQVNESLVAVGKPDVMVMHCLPAHRGEEISDEVIEGPRSVVFDQSENKMHLHQALLEMLLLGA